MEEVGATDVAADFSTWVVQSGDQQAMEQRAKTRGRYADLLESSDGWRAPLAIRKALADWDFAAADAQMDAAARVLDSRSAVERAGGELGVVPSETLRNAYESAATSMIDAQKIADTDIAALERIRAGVAAADAPRDALAQVGLWNGPPPELGLDRARAAFGTDDLEGVEREVSAATMLIANAPDEGRRRILVGASLVAALILIIVVGAVVRRRSRRRGLAVDPLPIADVRDSDGSDPPPG